MLLSAQSNRQEVAQLQGESRFIIKARVGIHLYMFPEENLPADIEITPMELVKAGEEYQLRLKIRE